MLIRTRIRSAILLFMVVVESVIVVSSGWTVLASRGRVAQPGAVDEQMPRTAIVLGSKVDDGIPGVYVRPRLDVAVDLYRAGRVTRILVSGNDDDAAGDEVRVMRAHLESRGVAASAIVDDPRGYDTAATCRRAADVYGVGSALVITQDFHVGRAVMLCRAYGVEAVGVVAGCDACSLRSRVRNQVREAIGSRPRAVWTVLRHSGE